MSETSNEIAIFGPFRLNRASYALFRRVPGQPDQMVELRPKAFDLLCYLVDNAGRTITQDEFLSKLWPETYVQPEVLKGHILAVRTALDDRAAPTRFIETVRGRGYRFIADVRRSWGDGAARARSRHGLPCVGREHVRDIMAGCFTQACSGASQVAFVTGEAGIGKTTLTEAFLREVVTHGAFVVTGRCLPGSGETDAYYPILEILAELGGGHIANAFRAALGQYAPAWLRQLPGLTPPGFSHAGQDVLDATPHRMARELCDALCSVAQARPLVILVEDIHWADQATLDLIQTLANRRLAAKLLVLATLRSTGEGTAGHVAGTLAQSLSLYGLARMIDLDPLSRDDVEEFLNTLGHAPPEQLVTHLHDRSEGNPLYMRAMLDALLQRGSVVCSDGGWNLASEFELLTMKAPPSLTQIVEAEISALPQDAQAVLAAASITEGSFSPYVNSLASGVDEATFETICEAMCRRAQLIRRGDIIDMPGGRAAQTYRFRHALFQEAAYDRQGSLARANSHGVIAARIAQIYAEDLPPVAPTLAHHFSRARSWPEAVTFLRMAARSTMQRFAHREATALLDTAIDLCRYLPAGLPGQPMLGALEELATIYLGIFDDRAADVYDRLTVLARKMGSIDVEARGLIGVGYALSWTDSDRSLDIMREAFALSAQITDPIHRARVRCSAQAWLSYIQGWSAKEAAGVGAEMEALRELGDPVAFHLGLVYQSLILFSAARYHEAVEMVAIGFSYLVAHGQEAHVDLGLPLWIFRLGTPWCQMSAGRLGESLQGLAAGITAYEANGDVSRSFTLRIYHAFLHVRVHDHAGALRLLDDTVAGVQAVGHSLSPNETRVELIVRGLAQLGAGSFEAAMTSLVAARTQVAARSTLSSWYWRLALQWGLVDAHLATGDIASAEVIVKVFLETACATEERTWRGLAWEASARVSLFCGDLGAVREALDHAWADIDGYDAPLVRWRLHAVGAMIAQACGDVEAATSHAEHQRAQVDALVTSLPEGHAGRVSLPLAKPIMPAMQSRSLILG